MFSHTKRNHSFSKGLSWLKCLHWPKGMFTLIRNMGHEKHEVLLVGHFHEDDLSDQVSCRTSNQKGPKKRSIKITMVWSMLNGKNLAQLVILIWHLVSLVILILASNPTCRPRLLS
jgi:hypothetical protein